MSNFNWARTAADLSHLTAKCILIFSIHKNRSAEGVSLITQVFYALVFLTRYTDLFSETDGWNYFFKIFYLLSSFYTISIMRFIYPRTREREIAWKMSAAIAAGCLALSPFVMLIFRGSEHWSFREWLWVFSQILESVCVLPQLLLLRQTTVPTVITSFYIVFLGSYRALYVVNWFLRELDTNDRKPNPISIVFGLVQTAFYVDFAWVYWTRQRVKLRNGGVVDADDLRRGWLLNRIFGNKHIATHLEDHDDDRIDDEESAPALGREASGGRNGGFGGGRGGPARAKWGSRGISVSADDGVLDHERSLEEHGVTDAAMDPDAKMHDPDDLARALDEDDEDGTIPPASSTSQGGSRTKDLFGEQSRVRNDEWNND
ncbi:ER lumen protein retaining receptor-domain-containing protein [Apodospora peruviana]|uniref:ER lumen protein retaining receptor-domain-containing protein n=1 Tax=Apodospora peruviana TaxID=516989 RepID=A0AAE0IRA5_9PEZI|nr:ER lumen protein retaining receptor-domain-containing protein [Apodospora peruviana]